MSAMTKSHTRITKQAMLDALESRIVKMADDLGLDERNGYAQVTGKGEAWNRAYGEFCAYLDLHRDISADLLLEQLAVGKPRISNTRDAVTRAAEAEGMGDQGGWG